jgi:quinol monooxygenase YgiN
MNAIKSLRTILASSAVALVAAFPASAGEVLVAINRFVVTPGQEAAFEARVLRAMEFYRRGEPELTTHLHRSKKDPQVFVLIESWSNRAAFEHHRAVVSPARLKEFGPTPTGMLMKPADSELFSRLTD